MPTDYLKILQKARRQAQIRRILTFTTILTFCVIITIITIYTPDWKGVYCYRWPSVAATTVGEACAASLKANPKAAWAYSRLAEHALATGRKDDALTHFRYTIELDPASISARRGLADILWVNGERDAARDELNKLYEMGDRRVETLNKIAWLHYYAQGNAENAMKFVEWQLELELSNAETYYISSLIYYNTSNYDKALSNLDTALNKGFSDPNVHLSRGLILTNLGRFEDALKEFTITKLQDPSNEGLAAAITLAEEGKQKRDAQQARIAEEKRRIAAERGLPKPLQKRVALILGIGEYADEIPPLKNATRDAAAIAKLFENHGYQVFGFPKTNFTRAELFDQTQEFETASSKADAAVVWYAGHGLEFEVGNSENRNYLIPSDFRKGADPLNMGFPLSRLISSVSRARFLKVIVVDACRDARLASAGRGGTKARGLVAEPADDALLVFSTAEGALAEDGDGENSPFTQAFIKTFQQFPKKDVRMLFAGVANETKRLTGNKQFPSRIDKLDGIDILAFAP